jgi:phosphoglycerol transferase
MLYRNNRISLHTGTTKLKIRIFFQKNPRVLLLALCSGIFVMLLFRNFGLYPVIFQDEYRYNQFSRFLPLSQSSIPGYLYLWIYSFTNQCGDGFLDCARVLNAFFLVSGALFVFLVAKRVVSDLLAVLISILSIVGPFNIYTMYFMPESLYFLGFWAFAWKMTELKADSRNGEWVAAGLLFGFSSLIKPHSLLLSPAILIYIAYIVCRRPSRQVASVAGRSALFVLAAAVGKFLPGLIFAGKSGITIFGSFYGQFGELAARSPDFYSRFLDSGTLSLVGHIMAITLLYGVPLFITALTAWKTVRSGEGNNVPLSGIALFAALVVLNLVFVTAAFTALATINGEDENLLHMRYYDFALPLFYIVAAGAMFKKQGKIGPIFHALFALQIGLVCLAAYTDMYPFNMGSLQSPEIFAIQRDRLLFLFFSFLSVLALAFCFRRVDIGAKIYFFLAVPLLVVSSFGMIAQERQNTLVAKAPARAGLFVRDTLSPEERGRLVVVGPRPLALYHAAFHMNSPDVLVDSVWPYDFSRFPSGKEWVLLVGEEVPPWLWEVSESIPMDKFVLVRVGGSYSIDLGKPEWSGIVGQEGLTYVEGRGARSVADKVEFDFAVPLPFRFDLTLSARSTGIEADKAFVAKVGNTALPFNLKDSVDEQVVLRFDNPARAQNLTLELPKSVLSSLAGAGRDGTKYGLELTGLEIKPIFR